MKTFLFFAFALISFQSFSQSFIRLHEENDFLKFAGDDHHFTQGARIEFLWDQGHLLLTHLLLRLDTTGEFKGMMIGQSMYTPVDLSNPAVIRDDRPYAGWAYLGWSRYSFRQGMRFDFTLYSELTLGIMGAYSGAKEFQTWLHRQINSTTPEGWQYQIDTEPTIDYRNKLTVWRSICDNSFAMGGYLESEIGLPFTRLTPGIQVLLGDFSLSDNPLLISPAIPGLLGSSDKECTKMQVYLSIDFHGKLDVYNATMNGGFFGNDIHTITRPDRNSYYFGCETSANIQYGRFGWSFSHYWRSSEFNCGGSHRWAGATATFGL